MQHGLCDIDRRSAEAGDEQMEVREAVATAKHYLAEFFADEKIENLGLEEIELEETTNTWRITLGFSRPWEATISPLSPFQPRQRAYKVVQISADTGKFISVKNREMTNAT
jgi:hypothetical protein